MRNRWLSGVMKVALAGLGLGFIGGWHGMPSAATPSTVSFNNLVVAQADTVLAQLHMVTGEAGWAVVDQHVAHTDNGGRTWQALGPRIPTGAFTLLVGLDARNAGIIVETGSVAPFTAQYEWTTNGGHTWHSVPIPYSRNEPPMAIQLLTPQVGWILTDLAPAMTLESAVILHTTDGGTHWTALRSSVFPAHPVWRSEPKGLTAEFEKSGVTFRSPKVGWVTGGNYAPHEVLFERTTNGGKTFAPQSLPAVDGQAVGATDSPIFTQPQTGWLPVMTAQGRGFERTTDGGQTWRPTPTVFNARSGTSSWSFVGAQDGWVLADYHLYRTTDGGSSWTPIAQHRHLPHWTAIDFVTATHGWATTTSLATPLWTTTNGGVTWKPVSARLRL